MGFGEVLTAMITPFSDDLTVDYEGAVELAEYLINNGSDGLVVLGTTGEVPTLKVEEKIELLEVIINAVGDQTTIIAGTGSYSTQDSIELTKKAEQIGVDGVMLVTPYYNKPPQDGLYEHFKSIAAVTSLPVMLYNVPGRTGRNIEPETVAKLSEIDNIVAIKEASGDVDQAIMIRRMTADDFEIYSGEDILTLPLLSIGGSGVVSVAAHLVGDQIKEMVTAFKAGKIEEAAQKNEELNKLFKTMFTTTNPIPVKTALALIGQPAGRLRPPLNELSNQLEVELKEVLTEYNLI
ncbi:4-hydroxy-tetrahydrodipicolinate synthase [Natroniella acetigena]|uniref:4-hydroxy-tetrahydrodipicolinate synthase n=1 Tax=Natroniella acetigena TaxID=52004 RepID=UPI00200AC3AB|nr:4-hydroxy-tetrahydrodipicolinate synthase [Natroniella acetigena]MCK8826245.1 4-hydroxy-tetrahydrodipicolinate synthase [Natroniella acetigena]